jgi:translation initiation factor IF-2
MSFLKQAYYSGIVSAMADFGLVKNAAPSLLGPNGGLKLDLSGLEDIPAPRKAAPSRPMYMSDEDLPAPRKAAPAKRRSQPRAASTPKPLGAAPGAGAAPRPIPGGRAVAPVSPAPRPLVAPTGAGAGPRPLIARKGGSQRVAPTAPAPAPIPAAAPRPLVAPTGAGAGPRPLRGAGGPSKPKVYDSPNSLEYAWDDFSSTLTGKPRPTVAPRPSPAPAPAPAQAQSTNPMSKGLGWVWDNYFNS